MAKTPIYWTLIKHWTGYEIMAVTSEKPGRMIYGRDADGMSTHRTPNMAIGRFLSQQSASDMIARLAEIDRPFDRRRKRLERMLSDLRQEQDRRRKALITGEAA